MKVQRNSLAMFDRFGLPIRMRLNFVTLLLAPTVITTPLATLTIATAKTAVLFWCVLLVRQFFTQTCPVQGEK